MGLRTFTFAGTSSSAYSMFITEAATYNVPERAVEMLDVPGRNGAYALDLGKFETVEVTYHVVVHKDTNANFQTELSDVRNWLASKVGYQRLTDDYNSNVYRMAIFKGGLETGETFVNGAEFDIVFECKPQRWLTSGETAVTVADGGTLSNPTPFEASPLLQVWGYGNVNLGSKTLNISNVPLGYITLLEPFNYSNNGSVIFTNPLVLTYDFDSSLVNNGDTIYIEPCVTNSSWKCDFSSYKPSTKSTFTYLDTNVDWHNVTIGYSTLQNADIVFSVTISATSFIKGTSSTTSASSAITMPLVNTSDGTATGQSLQLTVSVATSYDGDDTFTTTITCTIVADPLNIMDSSRIGQTYRRKTISADSSVQTVQPTYIDLDIGEAYAIDNGSVISLNNAVSMPSDLPTLPNGNTTVTYDNTVTDLKVTPRWWKV